MPPEQLMSRRHALALLGATAAAPGIGCAPAAQPAAVPPTLPADAHYLSLEGISRRIAAREVSPVALTEHMLQRIASVDSTLKSYATVMADQARADAKAAEEEITSGKHRGPLHGVPIAVKDLCYTKGVRTMGGSPVLKDFVPESDGTVVQKLREAGAVILGKLNLTEGALVGYHASLGIPLNPWNTDRWPGASSSGSGVATAAGLCFAAIGTDTGGSIRFPSAACGLVGLKPTYGRVSRHGVLALAESLDHVGPMARRVSDVAMMFDAIAGHDPKDPTSLTDPPASATAALGGGVKGLRIGFDRAYSLTGIDRGQADAIESALRVLEGLGATIVSVQMPPIAVMMPNWIAIAFSELVQAHAANYPSRKAEYGAYMQDTLAAGSLIPAAAVTAARSWRASFTTAFAAVLDTVDAMACPADSAPAWPITHDDQIGGAARFHANWDKQAPRGADFTPPANGFSPDGLPYSIQFVGRRLSEPTLCRIAYAYEQSQSWHTRHPQI
jgi:amidase